MQAPRMSVRAIAITVDGKLCLIRRERTGSPVYYVIPGGGVEDFDKNLTSALERELHEELAATGKIGQTVFVASDWHSEIPSIQIFKLVADLRFSGESPQGPEYGDTTRGGYSIIMLPITKEALSECPIKPDSVHDFLIRNLDALLWLAKSEFAAR